MSFTTVDTAGDDHRLKRQIGTLSLLFTAVGSIMGSGWLFGAMNAAQQAGPASIISWLIGAVMILFIGLTYAELGAMFPLSGGVVRFLHFAFGSFASYTSGWITWLATVAVAPLEVLAVLQYATNSIPWLQILKDGSPVLTEPGLVVACALLLLFCLGPVNAMPRGSRGIALTGPDQHARRALVCAHRQSARLANDPG